MEIRGGCHCGNISYRLHWPDRARPIRARACGCSFCTRHGGVYASHREARLDAGVGDGNALLRYRFGTESADFCICAVCGVVTFVTCELDGRTYAVVNVNTFEPGNAPDLSSSASDFESEELDARLERRRRTWIPQVTIAAGK